MEEMRCWSCNFSMKGLNPENIEGIDNNCRLPSILDALVLDENRVYCPHYSINKKVCNNDYMPVLSEEQRNMKDEYPEGKCPDCFEQIPEDMNDGDKCPNCGHIFHGLNVVGWGEMDIAKFDIMFDPVEYKVEKTQEGYNIKYIAVDNEPESPRQCDNFGTMICFHRKYSIGDEHSYRRERFNSWEELKSAIEENEDVGVILPLYLYDHSGITMKTYPFNDIWDSGQVGFIFVTKDKIIEEFKGSDSGENITNEMLDIAKKILEGEVALYDHYLTGDVYRLVNEKFDKDRQRVDSDIVSGYYGLERAREELKTFI